MKRDYMIEFRKKRKMSIQKAAKKCECSVRLLELLEFSDKDVTHPAIAERIGEVYELTIEQTEGLMPEHYRPSSPNYDPDKYRRDDEYADFTVAPQGWHREVYM